MAYWSDLILIRSTYLWSFPGLAALIGANRLPEASAVTAVRLAASEFLPLAPVPKACLFRPFPSIFVSFLSKHIKAKTKQSLRRMSHLANLPGRHEIRSAGLRHGANAVSYICHGFITAEQRRNTAFELPYVSCQRPSWATPSPWYNHQRWFPKKFVTLKDKFGRCRRLLAHTAACQAFLQHLPPSR